MIASAIEYHGLHTPRSPTSNLFRNDILVSSELSTLAGLSDMTPPAITPPTMAPADKGFVLNTADDVESVTSPRRDLSPSKLDSEKSAIWNYRMSTPVTDYKDQCQSLAHASHGTHTRFVEFKGDDNQALHNKSLICPNKIIK